MNRQRIVMFAIFIVALIVGAFMLWGQQTPKSTFKGPVGEPYVKGPTGLPPK